MMPQFSTSVRNGMLDAIETVIGVDPILKIRTGPPPADCAAADTGTVLATLDLPSDWMAPASGGTKGKAGTWEDTSADAGGRCGHYRLYASDGGTCHEQGYCAGPWSPSTNVAVDDIMTNDGGKVYRATTGGVTASSGGPTGTGSGISDGGAVWAYEAAGAEMTVPNGSFAPGQPFSVTAHDITAPNA